MRKMLTGLVVVVFVLGACASSQPDWIDSGKSKEYPSSRYLTGIGTANDLEAAKDRARANLAKVFSVKVSEVTEDITRVARKRGTAGTDNINETRVERIISSRTDQVLTGVRVAETWQGSGARAYYALVVLSRLQASNNLRQEVDRLDRATRIYVKRARGEGDILRKVRSASLALDEQVARQAYQKMLRVVDRSGRGAPSPWDVAKLSSDLEQLLRRVRISPHVISDTIGSLKTSVSSALASAGFGIDDGEEAEFVLDAKLDLEDIGYQDGWYWTRGVLEITLKERASKRIRGSVRWAVKAAGSSTGDAKQRIATKVDSLLKREIKASIIKLATR
ncbi:MAG: LPP20 family lipoprotein [Acidiferrobacterales bacterium]